MVMTYQILIETMSLKRGWTISRSVDAVYNSFIWVHLVVVKAGKVLGSVGAKGSTVEVAIENAYQKLLEYWVELGVKASVSKLNK